MDATVSFITDVIVSAAQKFVPSSIPKLSRPTPWWNRDCETAWRKKMDLWKGDDSAGFCRASHRATSVYLKAVRKYQISLRKRLGTVVGINSGGHSCQVWLGVAVGVSQQSPQLINWPPTSLLNYPAHPC